MGLYSVPKEIRDQRPAKTIVKKINGRFYVYEFSSTKVKKQIDENTFKWVTKNTVGKCIGQITLEEGFVPNSNYIAEQDITVIEYGSFSFLLQKTESILKLLKESFNAFDANKIYVNALIFVIEGFCYMKNVSKYFNESCLKLQFPHTKVGYKSLHNLYSDLGRKTRLPDEFQQKLIKSCSGSVAIDGHVIACTSENNDLSAFGYKVKKLECKQINWLMAYDISSGTPLASQFCNGAESDCVAVKNLFDKYDFSNVNFVVDRGFNTLECKKLMSQNGNSYITPMVHNRKDYRDIYDKIDFNESSEFFGYSKGKYSSIIRYQEFNEKGIRYFAFKDMTQENMDRQLYMKNIQKGLDGYSMENIKESEKDFGLFLLETSNMDKTAEQIFIEYKKRWNIETFYNYIDNSLDFNALYQQDYYSTQGLSFIIQIAGMIYSQAKKELKSKQRSLKDVLNELSGIKLVQANNKWLVRNYTKQQKSLCKKLGLIIPEVFSPASPT